ncbi:hypothetical protein ACFWBN_30355 [Streptomyces sp. NPDC059989]|uniref:hypothetical protein n=1 Tax=Streptomyces sp. NPDC059989 TaxID=3347026 RepID=UPI00369B6BEF
MNERPPIESVTVLADRAGNILAAHAKPQFVEGEEGIQIEIQILPDVDQTVHEFPAPDAVKEEFHRISDYRVTVEGDQEQLLSKDHN